MDDTSKIKKSVGSKIKKYRNNLGLTQFILGEKIGIDQRQIAQIESGKSFPSLKTLAKLATEFKCQVGDFFASDREEINAKEKLFDLIDALNDKEIKILFAVASSLKNV